VLSNSDKGREWSGYDPERTEVRWSVQDFRDKTDDAENNPDRTDTKKAAQAPWAIGLPKQRCSVHFVSASIWSSSMFSRATSAW